MTCNFKKPKFLDFLNLIWSVFGLIIVVLLSYWSYQAAKVPVELVGYRMGVDNNVWPGQEASGLVLYHKTDARSCNAHVRFSMTSKSEQWQNGTVSDLYIPADHFQRIEAKTPGEFAFTFNIPQSMLFGNAYLIGYSEFVCDGNPIQKLFPTTVSMTIPLIVVNQ